MNQAKRHIRYKYFFLFIVVLSIGGLFAIGDASAGVPVEKKRANHENGGAVYTPPAVPPYRWPLDFDDGFSSTFQEYRTNHFHAGFDLRTQQKTGFPVYAITSGVVYKIHMFSRNTGRGIYFRHDDGNTSVYYHLERFNENLEEILKQAQRTQAKKYIGEYELPKPVRVEKGALLAFSGETGVGFPHLHLELRDRQFGALNPFSWLQMPTEDKKAPELVDLLFRSRGIIPVNGSLADIRFRFPKKVANTYTMRTPVLIGGPFDMVLSTYDISDCNRQVAPYSISASIDGKPFYHISLDQFPYQDNNQLSFLYDITQSSSVSYFFQIFPQKGFSLQQEQRGMDNLITELTNGYHELRIRVEDFFQNVTMGMVPLYKYVVPQFQLSGLTYNSQTRQMRFQIEKLEADSYTEIRYEIYNTKNRKIATGKLSPAQVPQPMLLSSISADVSYIDFDFYLFNTCYYKRRFLVKTGHLADMTSLALNTTYYRNEVLVQVLNKQLGKENLYLQVIQGNDRQTVEPQCSNDYLYFRFTPKNTTHDVLLNFSILYDGIKMVELQERLNLIVLQEGVTQQYTLNETNLTFGANSVRESRVLQVGASTFPASYPQVSHQIALWPENFLFLDTVTCTFTMNVPNPEQVGICKYSPRSKAWIFRPSTYDANTFTYSYPLSTPGIYALMRDNIPPKITFAPPSRHKKGIQQLVVRISDRGKGVDDNAIRVWLNGVLLCTDYSCDCEFDPDYHAYKIKEISHLQRGKNLLKVEALDYAGNASEKSFTFKLK